MNKERECKSEVYHFASGDVNIKVSLKPFHRAVRGSVFLKHSGYVLCYRIENTLPERQYKSFDQTFSKVCGSRAEPLSLSAESEIS